jgi:multiple sugar transport system substrate-binding protein
MHKRSSRLLILMATVALAATACAGQGGTTAAPTTAPTAAPPASAAPAQSAAPAESAAPSASAAAGVLPQACTTDYKGTELTLLLNQHPWTDGMTPYQKEFEDLTGIKLNVQSFSEDLYFDKMEQTVRAAQGAADVYFLPMDSTGYSQFGANAIEPLTPYINDATKTSSSFDLADFPQGFLEPGTFPPGDAAAQLYGVPISFETYILFYNKDIVDKYLGGTVPTTMDELTAAAQKVTDEAGKDGIYGAVMRGIRSDTIMDTLSGVVFDSWGPDPAPPPYGLWFDGGWDKPRLTDPKIIEGLTNYAKMIKAGPPNALAIDWPDANTLFSQGKAAFFIDASLFGPSYEDPNNSQVAGKVGYSTLPPATAGGESLTGHWLWGLAVPKNAQHKDAGWCFIQWATSKEMTAKIGATTGGAPRMSSYDDPNYTGKLNPDYIKTVSEAMKTSRTTVVFKEAWKDGALAIVDLMLAIEQGKDPATEAAKQNEVLKAAVAK